MRAEESSAADAGEVGEERGFSNDGQGFRSLRNWLRKRGVQRVVLESTGRFHRRVHQSLFDEGLEVLVVNPTRSRRFAEAKGDLAKTDRVDAAMLAAYGRAIPELASTEPKGAFLERLESMLVTRKRLVDSRASLTQVGKEVHRLDKKKLAKICKRMSKEIDALDAKIKAHLLADPDMAQRYRILLSVPGIGAVNAAMLCCYMPELGYIGNRQAASLIGVAPFNRDSGRTQGARHIRGGRRRPRDGLFMAALSATRWNPDMKVLYERLTTNGKKHKIALVAVMRKLIILANVLLRDGREWARQAPQTVIAACG